MSENSGNRKSASISNSEKTRGAFLTDFTGEQCNIPDLVQRFPQLSDISRSDEEIHEFEFSLYEESRFSDSSNTSEALSKLCNEK
ncbi:MAG: hypothetical protein MHMPM18_003914 [Marteilia pararefringens]